MGSRREILRIGGLAGASTLVGLPADRAEAADQPGFGRAKSCLFVFLGGGPSHLDTFDPKPDAPAEVRGAFRSIATRVPGLRLCERLPRLARLADRFTVVRSLGHEASDHAGAAYRMLNGRPYPRAAGLCEALSREDHPHIGSALAAAVPTSGRDIVAFVAWSPTSWNRGDPSAPGSTPVSWAATSTRWCCAAIRTALTSVR